MRIVVVGGGISGLTTAFLARAVGNDTVCVEPASLPGGLIRSERHDGFLCEVGPQAVLDDASDTAQLLAALDLDSRVLRAAPDARRRFIYAKGALHPLPMSPPALLRSGLLSPLAKVRLLAEPFLPGRRTGTDDDSETLDSFGVRRLGAQAGRRLLNTAAIGIYATEATSLSAVAAFPRLAALEREYGSLLRGVMAGRKRGKQPGRPLSFPNGLAELPAALARSIDAGRVRGRVAAIEPLAAGGWRVAVEGGASPTLEADAVVVTANAATTRILLAPIVPEVDQALRDLVTAPVAVCCLGFDQPTIRGCGMDLAAYGFLVARGEQPRLLGCQYESSIFSDRAPLGGALLRAILGGRGAGFEPEIIEKSDDQIAARALSDLRTVTGLKGDPGLVRVWRHPDGIPVYAPGHLRRLTVVDSALRGHPGLFVLGQALRGVGVNEGIKAATNLVREHLSPGSPGWSR
jgi:protoporphyrinogen/coproporphyrinogen III oxidase